MALPKYDEIFLGVMKEKGHIMPFLDTVFGFLYRCTDFYRIQQDPSEKVGFPPGVAETCVLKVLKKWELQAKQDEEYYNKKRMGSEETDVPPAIQEVEVTSEEVSEPPEPSLSTEEKEEGIMSQEITPVENTDGSEEKTDGTQEKENAHLKTNETIGTTDNSGIKENKTKDFPLKGNDSTQAQQESNGDSYNGAVRDNYKWSQSIQDVDIQVPVPEYITRARDVQVKVLPTGISIAIKDKQTGGWKTLMEGDLIWRNNKDESVWSLEAGKHVQVHLEKTQERWWDALLVSEPKIDLLKIDSTTPMVDLPQDEQIKIQEIMWNQERKRQNLPTSDQLVAEKILKEAWHKEGSPFLGTEYDPTMINFGTSDLSGHHLNPS